MTRRLPLFGLALAALVALPAALSAQEPSPIAEYRQGLMNGLSGHAGGLRALLGGDVDQPDHVVLHARAIADVADMLMVVWPEGSGGEGTRALPGIWTQPDDFQTKLQGLRDATARLRERAESGDREGTIAAMRDVGSTCRDCHTTYRAREN